MGKKIDEILSESIGLSEDTKGQIVSLWESKISEAREEVAATLREEFARKFEHDKEVFAESIDQFLTDRVQAEIAEFAQDKKSLLEERAAYRTKLREHTEVINQFITESLAKEVKDLVGDRARVSENLTKLEDFILQQLAEEIKDFHVEKKGLIEQKVKMVAEGKKQIEEAKKAVVKRTAQLAESTIESALRSEITQFKDDIRTAKENEFGRKMFESFAAEFMTSHLNEGTELKKLHKKLVEKDQQINTLKESISSSKKLMESLDTKLKVSQDLVERQGLMTELLAPLSKDKKEVMKELLESVQTKNLQAAYNKYLPTVLNETAEKTATSRQRLSEAARSEKTGDKSRGTNLFESESDDSIDLKKILSLAGINK